MATMKIGSAFGNALSRHFGLPAKQVLDAVKVNTGRGEVFSVSLTIELTAADLIGIGRQMGYAEGGEYKGGAVIVGEQGASVSGYRPMETERFG